MEHRIDKVENERYGASLIACACGWHVFREASHTTMWLFNRLAEHVEERVRAECQESAEPATEKKHNCTIFLLSGEIHCSCGWMHRGGGEGLTAPANLFAQHARKLPEPAPEKTPGQVAYEKYAEEVGAHYFGWALVNQKARDWWERTAAAPVDKPKTRVPKVGDIVLYHFDNNETRPAIVKGIALAGLRLSVFCDESTLDRTTKSHDHGTGPGQWSFREDA